MLTDSFIYINNFNKPTVTISETRTGSSKVSIPEIMSILVGSLTKFVKLYNCIISLRTCFFYAISLHSDHRLLLHVG